MDAMATVSGRDAAGRFVAGQSGNPAGKRPGTRNRRTLLMAALRDGEDVTAARVVIDRAVSGDAVAARFVVALISPRPRSQTIHLDLPEEDCDAVAAFDATLRGLADGEITPDEALAVSRFLRAREQMRQPGPSAATDGVETGAHPRTAMKRAVKTTASRNEAAAPAAAPSPALQTTCISQAPQTARQLPDFAAPPMPRLQSACISRSPATIGGPAASNRDAAIAARLLQRLAAGAAVSILAGAAGPAPWAAPSR